MAWAASFFSEAEGPLKRKRGGAITAFRTKSGTRIRRARTAEATLISLHAAFAGNGLTTGARRASSTAYPSKYCATEWLREKPWAGHDAFSNVSGKIWSTPCRNNVACGKR